MERFHSSHSAMTPHLLHQPVSSAPTAFSLPVMASPLAAPRFSLGQLYVAWEAVKQPGGLYLLHGDEYVLELAQKMLSRPLLTRTPVVMVDGNNSFHLYWYTRMAQHFARRPDEFLRLIKISRAFTCHQIVSLMERVGKAAEQHRAPLVVVLGLLSTFDDENVPPFEANQLFRKLQRTLRDLADSGLKVLLACPEGATARHRPYLDVLKREAAFRLACERHPPSDLVLRLERPVEFKQVWTLPTAPITPIRYSRQLRLFQ